MKCKGCRQTLGCPRQTNDESSLHFGHVQPESMSARSTERLCTMRTLESGKWTCNSLFPLSQGRPMTKSVGILAYGSLINDPGCEIGAKIVDKKSCVTPFRVEYARKSRIRSYAPTLVPFDEGDRVVAKLLVVDLTLREAKDRLYRREINKVCRESKTYSKPSPDNTRAVRIQTIDDFEGIDLVIYASLSPNITDLNAEKLARLAITSARILSDGRDGITYLMNATKAGIKTPLSDAYRRAILKKTRTINLKDALKACRPSRRTQRVKWTNEGKLGTLTPSAS